MPGLRVERSGRIATFSGSWHRGEHTNFIPSKADLREPDAIKRYILQGWAPEGAFVTKDMPITAFGSCFAHNVSEHLTRSGYNVLGRELDQLAHIVRFGEGMVNSFAIRQQFEWAIEDRVFPENLWFGPNKEIAALDPAIRASTRDMILSTKLFIITLGLSEIWYDKLSGEAFWRAIPTTYFDPDRHGFRQSTVDENQANLAAVVAIIRRIDPTARVIFTLSPIPLMATFRPISCLTANSVSKAVLRVAIDQFMRDQADQGVYYFPSYEILQHMFTDPLAEDNRHPRVPVIRTIMEAFEQSYCVA